jgi:hypothetical protein
VLGIVPWLIDVVPIGDVVLVGDPAWDDEVACVAGFGQLVFVVVEELVGHPERLTVVVRGAAVDGGPAHDDGVLGRMKDLHVGDADVGVGAVLRHGG